MKVMLTRPLKHYLLPEIVLLMKTLEMHFGNSKIILEIVLNEIRHLPGIDF